MRHLAVRFGSAMCLVLAGCGHQDSANADRARSESIDRLAQSILAKRGVPGIAIAVLRDGKVFDRVTRGSADLATHRLVSSATPFQLASTTKIFSSAGVLLLVADGKVKLDDPIGKYLDGLPASWRPVTVRQLLSHFGPARHHA